MIHIISRSLRWLLGGIFIFSGLIKLNDPVGTSIKLNEYFGVFAADGLSFFASWTAYALFLSFVLIILEIVLGIALLIEYRLWLVYRLTIGLVLFFSFLTFYSAYFDKVTDCGCFGDAIKLTPWQSFSKDIFLLVALCVGTWLLSKESLAKDAEEVQIDGRRVGRKDFLIGGAVLFSLVIGVYAVLFLPFIDFRSYKVGAQIPRLMQSSEPLRYGYEFIKEGQAVVLDRYTSDSSYQFVGTQLLNPEALPKVQDYALWNESGDATASSLEGQKLLIIVHKADDLSADCATQIKALMATLPAELEVWMVTSSTQAAYDKLLARAPNLRPLPYYFADATLLKAMMRSNPGFVLLNDGTVKGKWSQHAMPDLQDLRYALR